jgi:hypothetical protein
VLRFPNEGKGAGNIALWFRDLTDQGDTELVGLTGGLPNIIHALRGVTVEGNVELSGLVIEALRGYRAEHARIVGPLRLSSVGFDEALPEAALDALTIGARLELRYGISIDVRGGSDEHW